MDDDLNFESNNTTSKRNVKQGRRAAAKESKQVEQPSPDSGDEEEMSEDDVHVVSEDELSDQDDAPPKPSKGGWGEESSGTASARPVPRQRRRMGEDIKDLVDFDDSRNKAADSDDDDAGADIPVIPDLEDNQDDEMNHTIAVVPSVQVNRVATYRDLEHDLGQHAALTTLDNQIDLKILTKCLVPESDIIEEDCGWTWDALFTEVSSELLSEWEAAEQEVQTAATTAGS